MLKSVIILHIFLLFQVVISRHLTKPKKPNILLLVADDTGYGDFQSFGNVNQEWGAVDDLAMQGIRFTHFTVPASMCSPSRAALLTGRYQHRSGAYASPDVGVRIFAPTISGGLSRDSLTIPMALKEFGYSTGMVGKWHLGMNAVNATDGTYMPRNYGFDYVGTNLPFTHNWKCNSAKFTSAEMEESCFLYNATDVIQQPIVLEDLTDRLVNDAKYFIRKQKSSKPWFFFMSFPQTHSPMFCNEKYCKTSKLRGAYGDNVNELQGGIARVLEELARKPQLYINTIVMFISDHGPRRDGCKDGGSAGPFRGGKGDLYEGGVRIPAIIRWPLKIRSRQVSHAMLSTMDLLPSFVEFAGGSKYYFASKNIKLDGVSIVPQLTGRSHENGHNVLFYYCGDRLFSMRYNQYKIHFFTKKFEGYGEGKVKDSCENYSSQIFIQTFNCYGKSVTAWDPPVLYNVEENVHEDVPLRWEDHPSLLQRITELADANRAEIAAVIASTPSGKQNVLGRQIVPCCSGPGNYGNCQCNYHRM